MPVVVRNIQSKYSMGHKIHTDLEYLQQLNTTEFIDIPFLYLFEETWWGFMEWFLYLNTRLPLGICKTALPYLP